MKIEGIKQLIEATVICGEESLDHEVEFGFASDLMSDVLTLDDDNTILITGLANLQSIRTAEMADLRCIILARNKDASDDMVALAKELDLIILKSKYSVFKTSGILFNAGLKPVY
ncbi:MAG: DRTGG domain-containing protein [Hyphomicrobiales bacterium]